MKVFHLTVDSFARPGLPIMVITPDHVTVEAVSAAWGYAVQYSAKGLMLPDWEAAKALLLARHPSWVFPSEFSTIALDLNASSQDEAES